MVEINIYKVPHGFYKKDYTDNLGDEIEAMASHLIISYEQNDMGMAFWYIRAKDQEEEEERIISFTSHAEGNTKLIALIKEVYAEYIKRVNKNE